MLLPSSWDTDCKSLTLQVNSTRARKKDNNPNNSRVAGNCRTPFSRATNDMETDPKRRFLKSQNRPPFEKKMEASTHLRRFQKMAGLVDSQVESSLDLTQNGNQSDFQFARPRQTQQKTTSTFLLRAFLKLNMAHTNFFCSIEI